MNQPQPGRGYTAMTTWYTKSDYLNGKVHKKSIGALANTLTHELGHGLGGLPHNKGAQKLLLSRIQGGAQRQFTNCDVQDARKQASTGMTRCGRRRGGLKLYNTPIESSPPFESWPSEV